MRGLDRFNEYFAGHTSDYVVIGGAACDLLLKDTPVNVRATKDIDMVLFVEGLA